MRMLEIFSSERTYLPVIPDVNYVASLLEQILHYMVQKGMWPRNFTRLPVVALVKPVKGKVEFAVSSMEAALFPLFPSFIWFHCQTDTNTRFLRVYRDVECVSGSFSLKCLSNFVSAQAVPALTGTWLQYIIVLCTGQVHVLVFTFSHKGDSFPPALYKMIHARQHKASCLILAPRQV